MINILDMIDDTSPQRQSKPGVILFSGPGDRFLKKPVEKFNRNEKLTYIEYAYATRGKAADSDRFVFDCRIGISRKVFDKARAYGLHKYRRQTPCP